MVRLSAVAVQQIGRVIDGCSMIEESRSSDDARTRCTALNLQLWIDVGGCKCAATLVVIRQEVPMCVSTLLGDTMKVSLVADD